LRNGSAPIPATAFPIAGAQQTNAARGTAATSRIPKARRRGARASLAGAQEHLLRILSACALRRRKTDPVMRGRRSCGSVPASSRHSPGVAHPAGQTMRNHASGSEA